MSVQLKDKNKQIPNGYRFILAETGWDSTKLLKSPSLTVITNALMQHLAAQPFLVKKHNWPTDYNGVENWVARYNAEICLAHGWTTFIVTDELPPPPPPNAPQSVGASFAASLKRTTSGIKLVSDWLGEELKPVAKELAEKRAHTCAVLQRPGVDADGKPLAPGCPQNQDANFWQRLDAMAAHKVKTLIAIKHDLELKTSHDDQLKSCQACDCWNELKVQTPLDLILKNSTPEVMAKLDPLCWVLAESK